MISQKSFTLTSPISILPQVGTSLTKAFNSIGVFSVGDLLYNFPSRYMDFRKTVKIGEIEIGDTVTVLGTVRTIKANPIFRSRLSISEITIEDSTGKIKVVWFNQPYITKALSVGDEIILSGKVTLYKTAQFTNPAYEIIRQESNEEETLETGTLEHLHTGRLVPVYKKSELIPIRTMRRLVKLALPLAADFPDYLAGSSTTKKLNVIALSKAIENLHFPENDEDVNNARFRIALEDILPQQLAMEMQKELRSKNKTFKIKADIEKVKLFLTTLPFELTPSQKRAIWDIFLELETGKPMNRLLQGDVGSGKTMVAILAALQTAGNGFQTVVLAPTEILAKQHYETFLSVFGTPKSSQTTSGGIALLTRSFALIDGKVFTKEVVNAKLKSGAIKVCIGTHALLQGKSKFKNLALLVIDEQHRFGVAQRSLLLENKKVPHLLSMSATPIPRTLAMSLYADISVSTLSHLPSGRKPVGTFVVSENDREKAYDYIRGEVKSGHQAFVVTPRVEDTSLSEVRSVKKEFARLQSEVFPNLKLGLLYGKMKSADKDAIMAKMAEGNLDILVTTSVIEIGIDIPNATAMIIEGSERFGLAQLHQLRGRIGRNNLPSKCFLFTTEASHQEINRLQILSKVNDGFKLAELDLEERGFGDLFGKQQSGFSFRFPQFISVPALKTARQVAEEFTPKKLSLPKFSGLKTQAESYLKDLYAE